MLNPLLVQLFGRDVVDRLENAGLESDAVVARLGAGELSARAGIAPDVAERVIALMKELCPAKRPARARGGVAGRRSTGGGARRKRKPTDRQAPAEPIAPSERAAAPSVPTDPEPDEESPEMLVLQEDVGEIDAFVDEAGLIAWMGFASRTGADSTLLSGVAEGILDTVSPGDRDQPQPATPAASQHTDAGGPEPAATAGSAPVTLADSLWEFGSRPHRGVTISPAPADESRSKLEDDEAGASRSRPVLPVPFHRRRSHDGH